MSILPPLQEELTAALYSSLREEILKATETQFQIIVLIVLSLGTVIGVSVQVNNAIIALAYPILVAALALAWAAEERGIRLKGAFLAHNFESILDERFRWDQFIQRNRWRRAWFYWGVRAIFLVAQVGALLICLIIVAQPAKGDLATPHYSILGDLFSGLPITSIITPDNLLFYLLFFAALASIITTIALLWHFSEYGKLFTPPDRAGTLPEAGDTAKRPEGA